MRPKVLIATPCRDALTLPYVSGLVQAVSAQLPYQLEVSCTQSAYVGVARNEAVEEARRLGCEIVVFWDADVGANVHALLRLLSHTEPIVGGSYAKRKPGTTEWAHHVSADAVPNERGLMPANDLPAGFLKVHLKVFDAIYDEFPHRHYQHTGQGPRCEYFPTGLTQKGSWQHPAEAKLDEIADIVAAGGGKEEILAVMARNGAQNGLPEIVGEDVAFCRLARAAGFTLWLDTYLILPHFGLAAFPHHPYQP